MEGEKGRRGEGRPKRTSKFHGEVHVKNCIGSLKLNFLSYLEKSLELVPPVPECPDSVYVE